VPHLPFSSNCLTTSITVGDGIANPIEIAISVGGMYATLMRAKSQGHRKRTADKEPVASRRA
jgi:hypothetical protein